jgi:spore germination cell wall hydrolase CwlJ-like protein
MTALSMISLGNPSHSYTRVIEDLLIDKKEAYCLAQVIYFEARGESVAGQIAVAQVTLNRKNSELFPNTICKVVSQKNPCQYSWHCDGKSDKLPDSEEAHRAIALANKLLVTNPKDLTNGALFFHSVSINPRWNNLEKTVEIGAHVFYRRS